MDVDEQPSYWLKVVEMYREVNVILLNGKLVKPSQVAINMLEDCSPLLYGLNKADHFRKIHLSVHFHYFQPMARLFINVHIL
jgi:hypothetical protein